MARVYADRTHDYTHFDERGHRSLYHFPEKGWVEVPDPIARRLTQEHPDKLFMAGSEPGTSTAVASDSAEVSPFPAEQTPPEPKQPTTRRRRRTTK